MPDKKSIILESVRKLIALDLSDEEIIKNLRDVGISEKDARTILDEVKGVKKKPSQVPKPQAKPIPPIVTEKPKEKSGRKQQEESQLFMDDGGDIPGNEDDLMKVLAGDLEEENNMVFEKKKEIKEDTIKHDAQKKEMGRKQVEEAQGRHRELQEKEIRLMSEINEQLEEMKKLKAEMERIIDSKVSVGLSSEYQKINTLINSKAALMTEKINVDMNKKHKDIDDLLDARVKEIAKINNEMRGSLAGLSEWEAKYKTVKSEIKEIEKNIEAIRAGGLKQLQGQSKKSVDELLTLIKRANNDLKTFIISTKKELHAEKQALETEIHGLETQSVSSIEKTRAHSLKEIESVKNQTFTELGFEKDAAITEFASLRDSSLKELKAEATETISSVESKQKEKIEEFRKEQSARMKELKIELDQKRDATIEKLDEIVSQKLNLTEKEFLTLKKNLLRDVNTTSSESKGEIAEFITKAQTELKRLDNRVTKTLELESEVIEDIMNEAKEKIERVKLDSQRELEEKINVEIREFKQLKKEINPEKVKKQIDDLMRTRDKIRAEISRHIAEKAQSIEKEYKTQIGAKLKEIDLQAIDSSKKISKIMAETEAKVKELDKVDSKINAMANDRLSDIEKEYNSKVRGKVSELEKGMGKLDSQFKEVDRMKLDIVKEKEKMIAQINAELSKNKNDMKNSVARYQADLNVLNKQASELVNQKAQLLKGLEPYTQMDIERITRQVSNRALKDAEVGLGAATKAYVLELGMVKEQVKKEAMQSVGADQIQAQIRQLNTFKEQFLKATDKNIELFNQRIKEFNQTSKQMEDHFNTRIKMIDQKMDELNRFEKNFAKAIGTSLEKMAKSNAGKK